MEYMYMYILVGDPNQEALPIECIHNIYAHTQYKCIV